MKPLRRGNDLSPVAKWSRLFSPDSFRWRMGLRSGDLFAFFAPGSANEELLRERRRWLDEASHHYACLLEEGAPLLAEFACIAVECGNRMPNELDVISIGRYVEPDFVLLSTGLQPSIVGGSVCFPSSWSLPEKLGKTLELTHAPVPQLNEQLGEQIRKALNRLEPGTMWERENWGLSRDNELNHHPSRPRRRLDESIEPSEVWVRVERQILYRMLKTGGILFGIRLELIPLSELMAETELREALGRSLRSMPPEIAQYKGVSTGSEVILRWLND